MIAKKFALAFGIAVVFPAMIHYGVSTFSPEPRWQDYHVTPLIDSNSAEYQKKDAEYRTAEKVFEKHLFAVAVPLGLITVIAGAFLSAPAVGTGLMFGGIFSVSDGYFNYWSELSAQLKFSSLLAAFIVLLVVGYWKLEKNKTMMGTKIEGQSLRDNRLMPHE
jgi:hypothetical protein